MIWKPHTRKPYPPTIPTARMGQMPKARMKNVSNSRRRLDFGARGGGRSVKTSDKDAHLRRQFIGAILASIPQKERIINYTFSIMIIFAQCQVRIYRRKYARVANMLDKYHKFKTNNMIGKNNSENAG